MEGREQALHAFVGVLGWMGIFSGGRVRFSAPSANGIAGAQAYFLCSMKMIKNIDQKNQINNI